MNELEKTRLAAAMYAHMRAKFQEDASMRLDEEGLQKLQEIADTLADSLLKLVDQLADKVLLMAYCESLGKSFGFVSDRLTTQKNGRAWLAEEQHA